MSDRLDKVPRLERQHTTSVIAGHLRDLIVDGTLAPGTQLREQALSDGFGVSRGPLREAIARLHQEGLLELVPNRGAFVISLSPGDVTDIYLARTPLEEFAALSLAKSKDPAAFGRLAEQVERMRKFGRRGSWRDMVEADLTFHQVLVSSVGSVRLTRMFETLAAETRMCMSALKVTYPHAEDLTVEHERLLEAIRGGRRGQITAEVRAHMGRAVAQLVET